MIAKDQYNVLLSRFDHIESVINRIDADLNTDRKDIQSVILRLGSVEIEINQLKSDLSRIPRRVAEQVGEKVDPVTQETQQLRETIEEKKSITLAPKKKWWKIF